MRTAHHFGISPQLIDNTLYDAFRQRARYATMYTGAESAHVVMEAAPRVRIAIPARSLYGSRTGNKSLSAFTQYVPNTASGGERPAVTISSSASGGGLGDMGGFIESDYQDRLSSRFTPPSGTAQAYAGFATWATSPG